MTTHFPLNERTPRPNARRAGALLLELVAAVALFSVTLMLAAPVVCSVAAIREQSQCRQIAGLELGNVMEQIAARQRTGETVSAVAGSITLNPATAEMLEDAELAVAVEEWDDIPRGVHVRVSLSWLNGEGLPAAPVDLHGYFIESAGVEAQP